MMARLDFSKRTALIIKAKNFNSGRHNDPVYTPLQLSGNQFGQFLPYIDYGSISSNKHTLAVSLDTNWQITPYKDGVRQTIPMNTPPTQRGIQICGHVDGDDRLLFVPLNTIAY
jgi:hypothetical protein